MDGQMVALNLVHVLVPRLARECELINRRLNLSPPALELEELLSI